MTKNTGYLSLALVMSILWCILAALIGLSMAGCGYPEAPEHSNVIDRTYCDYECQEQRKKNLVKFYEIFAKNPTGVKNWMLEVKYPKCGGACPGRVFGGECDVCGKEKK